MHLICLLLWAMSCARYAEFVCDNGVATCASHVFYTTADASEDSLRTTREHISQAKLFCNHPSLAGVEHSWEDWLRNPKPNLFNVILLIIDVNVYEKI